MKIADDYSPWCRNLITTKDREEIAAAGAGSVFFFRPAPAPAGRRWGAKVVAETTSFGYGATPGDAFRAAGVELAVGIVSMIGRNER